MTGKTEHGPGGNGAAVGAANLNITDNHHSDVEQQSQELLETVRGYIARGWAPLPIPPRKKGPLTKDWTGLRLTEADIGRFNGAGNVGIILGQASGGLVDIDLDCPEAVELAPGILPATRAIFGRAGKHRSHWLYVCKGGARTIKFRDPKKGDMLLELRGDGGQQTVFPPSVHPSGEAIQWEIEGEPAAIDYVELKSAARKLAACCLIRRYGLGTDAASLATGLEAADPCVAARVRELLGLPRPKAPASRGTSERSANARFLRKLGELSGAQEGHRNDTLNKAAFLAGQLIGTGKIERQRCEIALWNSARQVGLEDREIAGTIKSGIEAGIDKPYSAEQPEATQRAKLIMIGLEADLWHDKDGNAFATVDIDEHKESFAIKSTRFRLWLTGAYGERYPFQVGDKTCPSAPGAQALNEAINALTAKAIIGGEQQPAVRIGGHNGLIYLDLGAADWNAVEISPDGWRVVPTAPVRFIRPAGLRPLPVPSKGGNVTELGRFINITAATDFVLIVSWLLAVLRPSGPYPVLIVNGEQGAGKSILCRVLRRLVDPNGAELRSDTRNERDLLLAAKNGWIVALDNLSYVRNDLSDAICRIATKGAFATRALYTNDEEYLLEVCRPVLLNGIPPLASRPDLADRAVVCVLPTMDEAKRQPEEEFWRDFEIAAARILGALLDGVSGALRNYQSTKLSHKCRMMDFALWAEAGLRALGCPPGYFEAAYMRNRSSAGDDAVDADPVASAVVDLVSSKGGFLGTATDLLTELEAYVPAMQRERGRTWPKDAARLSNHLRRLPPLLRPRGITIDFDQRSTNAARKRLIEIKRVASM